MFHDVQADAVAVAPRRPGQAAYLSGQGEMRSLQGLLQNVELHLQLEGCVCMLILAAAATGHVLAAGHDPLGRWLDDGIELAMGEAAAFLRDARLHQFAGQGRRNKYGLARWNARQTIAAIDRLLDAQLHPWLI